MTAPSDLLHVTRNEIEDLSLATVQLVRILECVRVTTENDDGAPVFADALGGCERFAEAIGARLEALLH